MMFACLRAQGKEFDVRCGVLTGMSEQEYVRQWSAVIEAFNARRISDEDGDRLLTECDAYRYTFQMLDLMRAKGFRIPIEQPPSN